MLIKTGDNEDHQAIDGQVLNRIEKSIANLEKYREEKNNEIIVNYEEFIQEDPRRQKYLEETERLMILFFDYRTTIKAYKKN